VSRSTRTRRRPAVRHALLVGVLAAGASGALTIDAMAEDPVEASDPVVRTVTITPSDRVEPSTETVVAGTLGEAIARRASLEATPPPPPPRTIPGGVVPIETWEAVARCESGYGGEPDWSINTGNGFYGGLQFTLNSWQWVGGTGMPHEASRETQIAMAERLFERQGWNAWPACSRSLGLR
jgi:hypothetical protein